MEYWKWPESFACDKAAINGEKFTAGIDVGTTSTQAVIFSGNKLVGYSNIRTGMDFEGAADTALNAVLDGLGIGADDLSSIGGTGFAKDKISFAAKKFDEIQCHAKGARFMFGPDVHTVIDMGGQTVKAIRLFDWDRVRDFYLNDKCATGQGRNIEILCDLLHVNITEIGEKSLEIEKDPEPVSTTCWAFADTETMGLYGRPEFKSQKLSESQIYASFLFSVAWRILGVVGKLSPLDVGTLKVEEKLGLTGGLAKNAGITKRIERELGVEAAASEYDPMLAGAIGAALLAK